MKTILFASLISCLVFVGIVAAQNVISVSEGADKISAAMTTAQPGDILELAEGIYWETKTFNTITGDLTIRGAENAEAIIYGPTEVEGDLIHVLGNLWLENLILIGSDKSLIGIVNYHGGVETDGGEFTADKNNLYINNCMSLVFVKDHLAQHAGSYWGDDPWEWPLADNKWHPYDTVRVTNSLFYGADITNDRAIDIGQRQARYVEVRNSTFSNLGMDALEVNGGWVGLDYENPGPGSDLQYVTTIADHLTVFNTYTNCPAQYIGRGGDGIHYEWANRNQSMTNTIVFRSGRFCFKAKRGESELSVASYCMGDSANVSGDYSPPTVYYWLMTKGVGCWESNPQFNDYWNGDFSLNPDLSDAIGSASDGSNMGDLHWDDPATYWPNNEQLVAFIQKAKDGVQTSVQSDNPLLAKKYVLHQNYPNPFNPLTTIRFELIKSGHVKIDIYDVTGNVVKNLLNATQSAGSNSVIWDGSDNYGRSLASGVYFYSLNTGSAIWNKKMMLLK